MPKYFRSFVMVVAILTLVYLSVEYLLPGLYGILRTLVVIVLPFIIAALLAIFMEPMVRFLMIRIKIGRTFAVLISMLAVFGTVGSLLFIIINKLVSELIDLSIHLPRYVKPVQDFLTYSIERSRILYFSLPPEINSKINENLGSLTNAISNAASSLAHFMLGFASALPSVVLAMIALLIATFFFSRDKQLILEFWKKIPPHPWGERSLEVGREIAEAFINYMRAQLFLISLTTVQALLGLYIIGTGYAVTIGLLIGFFDILPVLGPAGIILPWAAWCLISGNLAMGIKLLVLYLVIWLVRQFLEAKVVASNLGLHPLAVLAAMYAGLRLMGVEGLFVGPITLIAVQSVYRVLEKEKIL